MSSDTILVQAEGSWLVLAGGELVAQAATFEDALQAALG